MSMTNYEMLQIMVLVHVFASLSCAELPPMMADNKSFVADPGDSSTENSGESYLPKDSILRSCTEVQDQLNPKNSLQNQSEDIKVPDEPNNFFGHTTPKTIGKIVNWLNERLLFEIGGVDNLFFSPFSISVIMAITYLGARGNTATEMEEALGYRRYLGTHARSIHVLFQDKIYDLENTSEEYKLHVGSGFFLQNGLELNKQYTDDLKQLYRADAKTVDFVNNGADAVKKINQWSFNKTEGKIATLLDKTLDPSTKMLLLNAIYFKGFWKYPFNGQSTVMDYFYKADGTKKKTLFMLQKRRLSYYSEEKLGYRFLSLPYKGNHLSMWLILPLQKSDFPSINVTSELLSKVRKNLRRPAVVVRIPKFQMSYKRDLTTDMKNLGLDSLFSSQDANLSGMRAANDLYASMMVHKAVIEVNEQGTEATAISGISFESRSRTPDTQVFNANHPFLFCISDKRSGTILFMGRVSDP